MALGVLMDTGPLVAYFSWREAHHEWAVDTLNSLDPPIFTCEAVLTEASFLFARSGSPPVLALEPVERDRIQLGFNLERELASVRALMERYANLPMSLADACLVRMAEISGLPICTLDSDFAVYRANRRTALTLITPGSARYMHEA
jgi:predicted nucleic acid-binding protein